MKSWGDWNHLRDDMDDADESDEMDEMDETDNAARQGTSFPDPWDGDHDIEYWVWSGEQLVPATPSQQAEIQETERIASARRRLRRWHNAQGQQRMTVRIRIVRGIRQTVADAWQMARHGTRPAASLSDAHRSAMSAQHRQDER